MLPFIFTRCVVANARGNKYLGRAVLGCLSAGWGAEETISLSLHSLPQAFIMADVCLRSPEFLQA